MDGVPTQTAGVSDILADDWNTYVRDNFDAIKSGHIVCTSSSRPTGIADGTMIYETDTKLLYVYNGSSWTQNNLTPVGMVSPFAGSVAPGGWLICNGAAVARTGVYAALFGVLSTTYGSGDGSTTFNLPNLLGRTIVGAGTGTRQGEAGSGVISGGTSLSARAIGQWFGDERMQAHTHSFGGTTDPAGAHAHNVSESYGTNPANYKTSIGGSYGFTYANADQNRVTDTQGTHSHTFSGNTGAHSNQQGLQMNLQPSLVLNYIIKY